VSHAPPRQPPARAMSGTSTLRGSLLAAASLARVYTHSMLRRRLLVLAILASVLRPAPATAFDWIGKIELDAQGLKDPDPGKRRSAVLNLGEYDIRIVKPYLMQALRDPNLQVRNEAGRILGEHKIAEAAPVVIAWLNEPDRKTKEIAADILANIGTPEAVAALIRTLGDLDDQVRRRAVLALGKIGTPAVVVPLIGRLEDDKYEVRLAAIEALEAIGDRRAMIPLVGAFSDTHVGVRTAAVRAVGSLGDRAAVPALLRLLDDQVEAIKIAAVTSLGNLAAAEATDTLIDNLQRGSDQFRSKVAYALGQIAKAPSTPADVADGAIRALVKELANDRRRSAAREALRNAGAVAVPALVAHLEGRIEGDPSSAVEILRDIHDPRATPALISELDRGRIGRGLILEALSASNDERALMPILGLLSDQDASVRMQAMQALEPLLAAFKGRSHQAADVIVALLEDPNFELRVLAAEYLGLLRYRGAVPELLSLADVGQKVRLRAAAIAALGEIGEGVKDPRVAKLLIDILRNGPSALQPAAADALIYIRDRASVPELLALAGDRSLPARHLVVRVLGGVLRDRPNPEARKVLRSLATDDKLPVSLAAIAAMGAMRDRDSAALLREIASALDQHRRRAAIEALGNIADPKAIHTLLRALRSSDDRISGAAAWALASYAGADTFEALLRAARGRGWATAINASAALALTAPADRAAKLLPLLHHRIRFVRVNAASALGRLGAKAAARPLLLMLADDTSWMARAAAARALSRIASLEGSEEVKGALSESTKNDPNDKVRAAAKAALEGSFAPPPRTDWRAYYFVDPSQGDSPVRQEPYFVSGSDGLVTALYTDARGEATIERFPPGPSITPRPEPKASATSY